MMHIIIKQTNFHGHYFKLWVHFHNTTIRRTSGRDSETNLPQPSPHETKCHNFPVIYPFIFTSLPLLSLTHTHSLFISISISLPVPCLQKFQQIHVLHSTSSSPSHPPVRQILVTNDCCIQQSKSMELAQQRICYVHLDCV
jgi:hypothetical protein